MSSNSSEQILIVESNNLSFNDNTLSSFRTRLQREIDLHGPHEIALLDATIPQQIYNVQEANYFVISRYGIKKRGMNKTNYVTGVIEGLQCYLEYTIRCKIPAGYYGTVNELLVSITENAYDVIYREDLQLKKSTAQKVMICEDTFTDSASAQEALAGEKYWYSRDSESVEDKISGIKGLKRIKFHKESQRVVVTPDTVHKCEQWRTQISVSSDIANIFGYDQKKVMFPHMPHNIAYSPFICKISPEDTIYIYSSVINNIRVSNNEVKLLRAIPFSYKSPDFGSSYFIEFNNAHFVKLNTARLMYLDFELRGVSGNLVQFEHGSKYVRLTLKIRPCKNL